MRGDAAPLKRFAELHAQEIAVNGSAIDFRQWKEAAMAAKFDCFVIVQASGD